MSPDAIFQARGLNFIVEKLHDELVVFDRRTNRAHLLDSLAATIYSRARDGCSIDDLAERMAGRTIEERRTIAQLGVAELERAGLVVNTGKVVSRRGLLKTLGSAAALPMVISILAPTPAAAATVGVSCMTSADCGPTPPLTCDDCFAPVGMATCQLCVPNGSPVSFCTSMGPGSGNSCLCCSGKCDDGPNLCEP